MTIKNLQTQLVQGKSQIRGLSVNSAGNTRQVISIMDVISEGPIKGLVNNQYSVFFNDEKFADEVDSIEGGALFINYTSGSTTLSGQPELSAEQGTFYVLTPRNVVTYTMTVESFNFDKDPQPFYNTPKGILLKGLNVFTETSRFFSRVTTGVRELARINLNNGQVIKGYLEYAGPDEYNTYQEVIFTPLNVTSTNQREIETELTGPVSYQNVELEVDYEIIYRSNTGVLGTNFPFDTGSYRTDISERAYKTYGGIKTGERGPTAFLSLRNIDSSSLEFRPGTADQDPIEGPGGIGNISITAGINEQLTKWEENLSPDEFTLEDENATVTINTTEMDLSAEQVSEVDEVRIAFNYDSLTSVSTEDGKEHESGAVYSIRLVTYTGGTRATGTANTVSDITRIHTGNSTVPISFEELIFLEQYRPFQDFEIVIERLKRHSGVRVLPNGAVGDDRDELNANCTISTVTSVIKEKFTYPYTALANVTFSSVDYSDTPSRTYEIYGKLVQVPSNYTTREANDGVNALYTGFWDGTFKPALEYTDNPAWVFYDILTNNNYGLGTWISADDIDKYSLYRIAKYCDELVDDGAGGLEPRFRSNIYLAKQADAYKVLKDMASIFLGMLYWMDGQIVAVNDEPKDALFTFSKSNVLEGFFSYENTGSKTRANQVIVSWNNPEESYSAEPLIVEDRENIISTGRIIKEEVAAFGATSRGQAYRYGAWKLWTAKNQTEIVNFATSIDAAFLAPGDIIRIQDADRFNTALSGRSLNIEKGLTLTHSFEPYEYIHGAYENGGDSNITRVANILQAGDVILPSNPASEGVLWEHGGLGIGSFVGIRLINDIYHFVLRAGEGDSSTTATSSDGIVVEIPISDIPEFDNAKHTVMWELRPNTSPGRARLWIDSRLVIDETTLGSAFESNSWSGGDPGGWCKGFNVTTGDYTINQWPADVLSDLRVYDNQTVAGSYSTQTSTLRLDRQIYLDSTKSYKLSTMLIEPKAEELVEGEENETYSTKKVTETIVDSVILDVSLSGTYVEVQSVAGDFFKKSPLINTVWVLQEYLDEATVEGSAKDYRILSISENGKNDYGITAVEHFNEKFDSVYGDLNLYQIENIFPDYTNSKEIYPPKNVYVSLNSDPSKKGDEFKILWDAPVDLEFKLFNDVAGYEIHHNIKGYDSPLKVGGNIKSYSFKGVDDGPYAVAVRAVNTSGIRSKFQTSNFDIKDKFRLNVPRANEGIGIGGIVGAPLKMDGSVLKFVDGSVDVDNPGIATIVNPTEVITTNITALNMASLETSKTYQILLDTVNSELKPLIHKEVQSLGYWYVPGYEKTTLSGTLVTSAKSNFVQGTSTLFTSELSVGDVIYFDSLQRYAKITNILTNERLIIDRSFSTEITGTVKKAGLTINFEKDSLIGKVLKTGSTYTLSSYLSLDSTILPRQFKTTSVYKKAATVTTPTGGSYSSPVPSGWSASPQSLLADGDIVYVSTRTFSSDGQDQDSSWSFPAIYAQREDGSNIDIRIDSSEGTVFKNNTGSTILKATVLEDGVELSNAAHSLMEYAWTNGQGSVLCVTSTTREVIDNNGVPLLATGSTGSLSCSIGVPADSLEPACTHGSNLREIILGAEDVTEKQNINVIVGNIPE